MSGRPGHRCTHPYPYVSKHTLPPAMSSGRLMKAPYRRRKKKAAAKNVKKNGIFPCGINGCTKQFAREADLKRHQKTAKLHALGGL